MEVETQWNQFEAPFLVMHGLEDQITDPNSSVMFFRESPSLDKTMRLYPGFWHSLLSGESPKDQAMVYREIVQWLNARI